MGEWWRIDGSGARIKVRLTPKGGADRIDGTMRLADGATVLAARVRAAAEKGEANAALEKLMARALGVAAANVSVVSGHKGRRKTVHVAASADELTVRLAALGNPAERNGGT
jgi:uncharacterized protein